MTTETIFLLSMLKAAGKPAALGMALTVLDGDIYESYQSPYDDSTVSDNADRIRRFFFKACPECIQAYVDSTSFPMASIGIAERYGCQPAWKRLRMSNYERIRPVTPIDDFWELAIALKNHKTTNK